MGLINGNINLVKGVEIEQISPSKERSLINNFSVMATCDKRQGTIRLKGNTTTLKILQENI